MIPPGLLVSLVVALAPQGENGGPVLSERERSELSACIAEWFAASGRHACAPARERQATATAEGEAKARCLAIWDDLSDRRGALSARIPDLRAVFANAFPYDERQGSGRLEPLPVEGGWPPADFFAPSAYRADRSWRAVLLLPGREEEGWAEPENYFRATWVGASVQADTLFLLPELGPDVDLSREDQEYLAQLRTVLMPLGELQRRYRFDRERVFLDCGRGACAFGLRLCADFPDRFAGLILRWPEQVPDLRLGSLTSLPVALLESPVTHGACQSLRRRLEDLGVACTVVKVSDEPPHSGALPDLDRWMQGLRRISYPSRVVLEPNDVRFKKGYWVALGALDPAAEPRIEVVADRDANRIRVEAKGITDALLYLNDELVDLGGEIVLEVNGHRSSHRVQRSLERMVDLVRLRYDPTSLFPGELAVVVPTERGPQDPFETFDAAYSRSAWTEAVQAFLQVPRSAQGYADRLGRAGIAAHRAGQHELALELLAENAEAGGETAATLQARLGALAAQGDLRGLTKLARSSVGAFPDAVQQALLQHEASLLPFADGLMRERQTALGLWVFESLAAAGEGWRMANLALAYRKVGRLADAEEAYRRALDLAPEDEQIWNDYGLFLRAAGRWQEAADALWRSHSQDAVPGQGPAITNLVQMELLRPGSVGRDPLPAAIEALAVRPEAEMLRRLVLDLALKRAQDAPDKGGAGR